MPYTSCFYRYLLLVLSLLIRLSLSAQSVSVLTWNIQDLGRTKDENELNIMVQIMREHDLVLIQEVVAKDPAGAQKVAWLADALNRTGAKWDYRVSDPTNSPSVYIRERYAMLWKPSVIRLKTPPHLDMKLAMVCDREPYIAQFQTKQTQQHFWVVNFHARRFDQQPDAEIMYFHSYPERFETDRVLIAGDFNLDETHSVWNNLKDLGFAPALNQAPTTLKRACTREGDYLNYPIDNIFYPAHRVEVLEAGRVDFVPSCEELKAARGVSDHLPVYLRVRWK